MRADRAERAAGQRWGSPRCLDRFQRALDRLHDADVSRAAAKVAGQLLADSLLIGLWNARDDIAGHHQHAGSAKTALQRMMLGECFPQDVHDGIVLETFE